VYRVIHHAGHELAVLVVDLLRRTGRFQLDHRRQGLPTSSAEYQPPELERNLLPAAQRAVYLQTI
jgi:hypothetical protein